jgi:hypothetical protein
MFRLEFEFGQAEVLAILRGLLLSKGREFEENRREFGYMLAEAVKRSEGREGLYIPYRAKYRALVRFKGDVVEFRYRRRVIGRARLPREIDPQDCQVVLEIRNGSVYLGFHYPERNLPIRKGVSKGELLKLYRQMAFYHVPVEFREEIAKHLRSKRVFFDTSGEAKPNFELRCIEEYYKCAREGRFLALWSRFKALRDEIALENKNLVYEVMRRMRVRAEEYADMFSEGFSQLMRAVGMWDPEKGALSTIAYRQIMAQLMKVMEENKPYLSLDVSIGEDGDTFGDMLHDPRTHEGELFFSVAEVF